MLNSSLMFTFSYFNRKYTTIWNLSECNQTLTRNTLVRKRTLNQSGRLAKLLRCVVSIYLHSELNVNWIMLLTLWSKSTLRNCQTVKELFPRNRWDIWNVSNWKETQTHNHLVCKRKINHLAKWLSCVVSALSHLYGALILSKRVCDMIKALNQCTIHIGAHNRAQSLGQFG